jgi:hypothetical protein
MFSKILIVTLIVAFCAMVAAYDATVVIQSGEDHRVGVYFPGEKNLDHEIYSETTPEHLLAVMNSATHIRENVNLGTGFVLRSSDLRTRVRVVIKANPDKKDKKRPFALSFYNLAYGDRGRAVPVELQHSKSGFIWIDGGHVVTHVTDFHHVFTIRDGEKNMVFSIAVQEVEKDL